MIGNQPAVRLRLSDEEFYLLNELLERQFGLYFPEHKRTILESRLRPRLQSLHLMSFMDYYYLLQSDTGEMRELATLATNNETYFFREQYQFEALVNDALDELLAGPNASSTLRILCAGCSSGEEAYTIAFYLRERCAQSATVFTDIDAFDVDPVRVVMARRAEYRTRSLREMNDAQIAQYLDKQDDQRYSVKSEYRSHVSISSGNLIDLRSFRRPRPYDVVFCRNVLIYFSDASFRRAIDNLAAVLRPGGLLFLGHSESIIGMTPLFETVRFGSCIGYRRVAS